MLLPSLVLRLPSHPDLRELREAIIIFADVIVLRIVGLLKSTPRKRLLVAVVTRRPHSADELWVVAHDQAARGVG